MSITTLTATAQKYFPNLKVVMKTNSSFMKFLTTIMFFNKGFMTQFLTTIGSTIYSPSEEFLENNSPILIHEIIHLYDEKRIGFLYNLICLFPQILVLPVLLLLFFFSWHWVLPLAIICLLPWPAPGRAYFERRAYLVQLFVYVNFYHLDEAATSVVLTNYFKNSTYYWMLPWQSNLTIAQAQAELAADKNLQTLVDDLVKNI